LIYNKAMNSKPRLYHLVAINEKTGKKVYLTRYPMEHAQCMTMKSKQSDRVSYVRIQVEEV
jgi:precorrin-2 methylase